MKTLLSLVILITSLYTLEAQKVNSISVQSETQKVMVGSFEITAKTKLSDVLLYLGMPNRIEKIAGKERHYIYDSLGIAIDAGKEGKLVEAISINFNWDKDKKIANMSFNGQLKLDDFNITELTTTDQIKQNTKVKEIVCMGPSMCMSNPSNAGMAIMIGYNSSGKMTQIALGFKVK